MHDPDGCPAQPDAQPDGRSGGRDDGGPDDLPDGRLDADVSPVPPRYRPAPLLRLPVLPDHDCRDRAPGPGAGSGPWFAGFCDDARCTARPAHRRTAELVDAALTARLVDHVPAPVGALLPALRVRRAQRQLALELTPRVHDVIGRLDGSGRHPIAGAGANDPVYREGVRDGLRGLFQHLREAFSHVTGVSASSSAEELADHDVPPDGSEPARLRVLSRTLADVLGAPDQLPLVQHLLPVSLTADVWGPTLWVTSDPDAAEDALDLIHARPPRTRTRGLLPLFDHSPTRTPLEGTEVPRAAVPSLAADAWVLSGIPAGQEGDVPGSGGSGRVLTLTGTGWPATAAEWAVMLALWTTWPTGANARSAEQGWDLALTALTSPVERVRPDTQAGCGPTAGGRAPEREG